MGKIKVEMTLKDVSPGKDFWYPKEYNKSLIKLQEGMPGGLNAASRDFGSLVQLPEDLVVLAEALPND